MGESALKNYSGAEQSSLTGNYMKKDSSGVQWNGLKRPSSIKLTQSEIETTNEEIQMDKQVENSPPKDKMNGEVGVYSSDRMI